MTSVPSSSPFYSGSCSSSDHGFASRRSGRNYGDWYLLVLAFALLGYALISKSFAYIGVPPLFISEVVLSLGVVAFARANCLAASIATPPAICLSVLMAWAVIRTIPYIPLHGVDALRDSVTLLYGALAFIVTALLLQDSNRLNRLVALYGRFAIIFPPAMLVITLAALAGQDTLPKFPGTGLPILTIRPGDQGVHLAGVSIFVLLGFCRRPGRVWGAALVATMLVVATQNRGALLAMMVPISVAVIVSGKWRSFIPPVLVILICISFAYAVDLSLPLEGRAPDRVVGARQLVKNALSILNSSNYKELDGTKQWRLAWWQTIQDYTLFGDYFWTGKGFGVNLAESDGFVVGKENPDAPLLRSPHNAHLAILARTGVPGLALWLTTLIAWFAMLISTMVGAKLNGDRQWFHLFLFLQCYILAILITASFDIALEGPILGFWFWSLFGTGIGSVMIYRARPLILKKMQYSTELSEA